MIIPGARRLQGDRRASENVRGIDAGGQPKMPRLPTVAAQRDEPEPGGDGRTDDGSVSTASAGASGPLVLGNIVRMNTNASNCFVQSVVTPEFPSGLAVIGERSQWSPGRPRKFRKRKRRPVAVSRSSNDPRFKGY